MVPALVNAAAADVTTIEIKMTIDMVKTTNDKMTSSLPIAESRSLRLDVIALRSLPPQVHACHLDFFHVSVPI